MTIVLLEVVVWRVVRRVEVKDLNVLDVLAGKQVATIGENDLSTSLNVQVLVANYLVRKDVHHADLVVEADYDLETGRVECHTAGFFLEHLVYLQFEAHGGTIAPDFHSLVTGARRDQVLFYADIHAGDGARVEWVHQVLVHCLNVLVVKRTDCHPEDLICVSCEHDRVVRR